MSSRNDYSAIRATETSQARSLTGWEVLTELHTDAKILLISKIVRLFGFGFLAVVLVVYLAAMGFPAQKIGMLFTLTLLGDAAISLFMTSHADKFGRKKTLLLGAALSTATSFIFCFGDNFWLIVFSGIFGIITPSGNEIGPFMAIELSALAQVTPSQDRTRLMAWYNLGGSFASAIGAIVCGGIVSYFHLGFYHLDLLHSYRVAMLVYASTQILLIILFWNLSSSCEVPPQRATVKAANPVALFLGLHKSKAIVMKLSLLFMIDSFAGSFVLQSFISSWFSVSYATNPNTLGTIVFICNIVAGISSLFAAKLADNIGLIMTMFVTHLPSNFFLILVPMMPTQFWSIAMICLRYSISQMDVPTRNAYVQSVVDEDERSAANGVTNVVRSIGASTGPLIAGMLYANPKYINYPFYVAGVLKICYDLLLVGSFLSVKPPEEIAKHENAGSSQKKSVEITPLNKA